ncbi:MAG: outer membrane receptor protein involved in Fe transport [Rhodothermales bacterium]|jgi:outer membrane receptor protein involved in Fe transport
MLNRTPRLGRLAILLGLVGSIMVLQPAMAQTGKVSGTVIDDTGLPLPGVNVLIDGTLQGTASNLDGEFVIIGVRPGSYTIVASFIGFSTQRREGVRVSVDLTTTVDFTMAEEIFQGEEIVVTAEANAVRKDVTSSESRVNSETLDRLPVTELGQVLEVQAGITNRNGLHVRGGRSSEIVFMVDGVPVTDSYDGSTSVQLENDGIEELQIISGTFNAEYGNAMSGVINVVTKEGGRDYKGSFSSYIGSYAVSGSGGESFLRGTDVEDNKEAGIEYRDVDPYSYLPFKPGQFYNTQLALEGPIMGDKLTFFALGRFFNNDGWLYGANIFDINGQAGDSTLVPMNNFERLSWQANLRYRASSKIILNLIGQGQSSESRGYNLFRRWSPDGRSFGFNNGYNVMLKMTHLVSATTFYTLNVSTFRAKNESYLYDDPFDARYNGFNLSPPDSVEYTPGNSVPVSTGFGRYGRGGTDLGRFERTTDTILLKGDVSSQIGRAHLTKAGFQVKIDRMNLGGFSLQPASDASGNLIEPFQSAFPDSSSSRYTWFEDFSPISLSAYVQDKIEFENFIVNAGLRLDYFDSRAQVPLDPSDPNIFSPLKAINRFGDENGDGVITVDEERADNRLTASDREAYWWADSKSNWQVSPRLGVAYPITEQGVIHFSYGIFFQVPTVNQMSANFGYKIPNASGSYGPFGNPNLDAQKTTMYEIGFKQGFGEFVLDVTGYYRDVRSWVSTSSPILAALPGINYVVFTNRDYANTRGVTASLKKNFAEGWGFDLNYTFQVAEGSNSNPSDEFFSLLGNNQPTLALLPLDWDQRHKIAGAVYAGGDDWGSSIRFRAESGFPYTPSFAQAALTGNDVQPEFPRNSRRITGAVEADFGFYKQFTVGNIRPRLTLDIFNVLDTRNVNSVFSDTGEPDVTLDQLRTGQFDPGYFVRPDHFREPRRIQVGVDFRF